MFDENFEVTIVFDADCNSCIDRGFFFCSGDATCRSRKDGFDSPCIDVCRVPEDFISKDFGLCIPEEAVTKDPLYMANKWMYEMINVLDVWEEGFTGKGVSIRINDELVDYRNKEFLDRFDKENSCEDYDPKNIVKNHGTAVAGIILGEANNGHCATGIAYNARFSSCYFNIALDHKIETFDISNNSWGLEYVCVSIRM